MSREELDFTTTLARNEIEVLCKPCKNCHYWYDESNLYFKKYKRFEKWLDVSLSLNCLFILAIFVKIFIL